MVDFPSNPNDGDIHTEENVTWIYKSPPDCWQILAQDTVNPVEIVEADVSAGWQVWGDVLVQWGRATPDVNGNGSVTFAQPFKTPPACQVVVAGITPGSYEADQQYVNALQTPTTTGLVFEQRFHDVGGSVAIVSDVPSDWIAIGEAPDDLKKPKVVQTIGGTELQEFHDPTGVASWRIVGNTLECWGRSNSPAADTLITFPKVFAQQPVVTMNAFNPNVTFALTTQFVGATPDAALTVTEFNMNIRASNEVRYNADFTWHAIGKWDGVS